MKIFWGNQAEPSYWYNGSIFYRYLAEEQIKYQSQNPSNPTTISKTNSDKISNPVEPSKFDELTKQKLVIPDRLPIDDHREEIIDKIHEVNDKFDGLIINPAAFTHSSIAILDSLRAIDKPKIEIHLSNIYSREEYRKKSITSEGVHGLICGFGGNSYLLGIEAICKLIYK